MAQRGDRRIEPGLRDAAHWGPATVSRQLQFVAGLVLAIVIGVAAQQLWQMRNATLVDTERQMARLDMVFAEQTGRAVETVDLMLRSAVEMVQSQRGAARDDAALGAVLRHRIEGVRQIVALAVTDPAGVVVASSAGAGAAAQTPEAARLLQRYAQAPDRGLQISEPFREPDGSWSALMIRAIPAPGDAWDGLVAAHLNLQYFEEVYRAVELDENGAIMLHRRDGTVLARYPHNDQIIGTSYAELSPFRDILAQGQSGTVVMDSPLDGSTRVLAIRALKSVPLAVNISVDETMVMAKWRRQAVVLGGVALLASAMVTALLLVLARRSRQVEGLLGDFRRAKEVAEQASARMREQIVERERAEAALRQSQRIEVVGQLTGGVAHDFNNLLTVVLGNLDVLESTVALAAPARGLLATVRSAAERGAALTAQLLAFARRQPLVAQPLDVGCALTGMADLLRSALGSRVRVVTRLEPGLWPAMIDPTQIELLVLNLAINARDAMPDGGTLTIIAANATLGPPHRAEQPPAGDYVRLTVADTGTGMTPEVLAKAFEPFFTTKGPSKGSGLGLSQVYGVVRQSGGGIEIESAPGVGTSVRVYLPRARTMPARQSALAAAPLAASAGGVGVLLVDDDEAVRVTTAHLLRHLGYTVTEADSGAMALQLLDAGLVPDVVLTDVAMPGMSGPEFARAMRQGWPRLPVVFFSGYADPQAVAGVEQIKRLIRKPFRPAELITQLEAARVEAAATV